MQFTRELGLDMVSHMVHDIRSFSPAESLDAPPHPTRKQLLTKNTIRGPSGYLERTWPFSNANLGVRGNVIRNFSEQGTGGVMTLSTVRQGTLGLVEQALDEVAIHGKR